MKKFLLIIISLYAINFTFADDIIVYTANQDFISRIYLLEMDGSVYNYFEYEPYRFVDMEVINNELYVAEAFAPRVYKVDLETGALDVVIDDWSLFVFYGVAFDGEYFYIDEWSLNRYDIDGNWDSSTSFDEYVLGAAYDGNYYYTWDYDYPPIKCYDISTWPNITPVLSNNIEMPSNDCRGLWFDGEYFWTAESKDGLGKIFKFDHNGNVIQEWTEPAFRGWGACVIEDFIPPVPVELTSFTADVIHNEVHLEWETATETNNKGFEIQKTSLSPPFVKGGKQGGSKGSWEDIGFVDGAGTTSEPQAYSYVINEVEPGKYKYRLKQIDYDGTFEYSEEVEIEIVIPEEFSLSQNYPNPFNPTTTIKFTLPSPLKGEGPGVRYRNLTLKLYDVLGNEISTLLNESKPPGNYEVNFDASGLPSGIYFYRLTVEGGKENFQQTRKMILTK